MKTYERKSFPRTARDLKVMYEKGSLSFDNAVQRSFVWKNTVKDNRMSMLIDSMLRGLPIPAMYCNCIFEDIKYKVYDFIDGKQRTTTIIKFLNNEFSLVGIPTFEEEDGTEVDLNGLTYENLPEEYQDRMKTYSLTVNYYENMEQDDAEEMFRRLNNGKSLTSIELARVKAVSRREVFEMGKHEFFSIALSEKSLIGHANEDIVIKVWITLYSDRKSLEKRDTNPIMERTKITNIQVKEILGIFDTLTSVYKSLSEEQSKKFTNKLLNKTNIVSLSTILKQVNDDNVSVDVLEKWIIHFFNTKSSEKSISDRYNEAASGREAVTEAAVITRMNVLTEDFQNFLAQEATEQKTENPVGTDSTQDDFVMENKGQEDMSTEHSNEVDTVVKNSLVGNGEDELIV